MRSPIPSLRSWALDLTTTLARGRSSPGGGHDEVVHAVMMAAGRAYVAVLAASFLTSKLEPSNMRMDPTGRGR